LFGLESPSCPVEFAVAYECPTSLLPSVSCCFLKYHFNSVSPTRSRNAAVFPVWLFSGLLFRLGCLCPPPTHKCNSQSVAECCIVLFCVELELQPVSSECAPRYSAFEALPLDVHIVLSTKQAACHSRSSFIFSISPPAVHLTPGVVGLPCGFVSCDLIRKFLY